MTKKPKTPLSKRAATALASVRDEHGRHLEPAFKLAEPLGYDYTVSRDEYAVFRMNREAA
jgi:hypothetical protein